MTVGINTSVLAGQDGKKLTARQVEKPAAVRSSSATCRCACSPTERPDAWEVQGRGELQLAVLVETMRREGFELTVGKPQVVIREIDGKTPRAGRAAHRRRSRGLPRCRHPAPRVAQGPHGADGQPRHRLGAHRLPRSGARPHRVPHRVHDRDTRHRHAAPRVRRLGTVVRRTADPSHGQPGRRPARHDDRVRVDEPAGARRDAHRSGRRGLRGHDRRRERAWPTRWT